MELSFPLLIDALSECGLVVDERIPQDELSFSRMEIYDGQGVEDGVLYVTESTLPDDHEMGTFLVASQSNVPEGAVACTANATAIEVSNAVNRYLGRMLACIAEIDRCCHDNRDPQALCQAIADFTGNPVVLYDDTMMPVAQTEFPHEYAMSLFGLETLDTDYVFRSISEWDPIGAYDATNYSGVFRTVHSQNKDLGTVMYGISVDGRTQGFLEVFGANKPITDGEMLMLEYAGKMARQLMPLRNARFIEHSLEGRPPQGPLANVWLSALQWLPNDELYVIAANLSYPYEENRHARKAVERTLRLLLPNSDYTTMDGTSIVVANSRFVKRAEAIERFSAIIPSIGGPVFIGVSDFIAGISQLRIGYEHAQFAAKHAQSISPSRSSLVLFEQCRFAYLADLCDFEKNSDFVCDSKVKRLFEDDCASGSDNTLTVKVYIETGFNLNATAERLVVHRNTVAYRLKQIAERYRIDLSSPVRDPELIFQTLLSCKLLLADA